MRQLLGVPAPAPAVPPPPALSAKGSDDPGEPVVAAVVGAEGRSALLITSICSCESASLLPILKNRLGY